MIEVVVPYINFRCPDRRVVEREAVMSGPELDRGRVKCKYCDEVYHHTSLDSVNDPRLNEDIPGRLFHCWDVCPFCRGPEPTITICDIKGCEREVNCGCSYSFGYLNTCYECHTKLNSHEQLAE